MGPNSTSRRSFLEQAAAGVGAWPATPALSARSVRPAGPRVAGAIKPGLDSCRQSRLLAFDPRSEKIVRNARQRPRHEGAGKNVEEPKVG